MHTKCANIHVYMYTKRCRTAHDMFAGPCIHIHTYTELCVHEHAHNDARTHVHVHEKNAGAHIHKCTGPVTCLHMCARAHTHTHSKDVQAYASMLTYASHTQNTQTHMCMAAGTKPCKHITHEKACASDACVHLHAALQIRTQTHSARTTNPCKQPLHGCECNQAKWASGT